MGCSKTENHPMSEQTTTIRKPRRMARVPRTDVTHLIARPAGKPHSKASQVELLLQSGEGVSLADLCRATGWQPHTCRAFLTGLRKKGRDVEKTKREDGTTIYRIILMQGAV